MTSRGVPGGKNGHQPHLYFATDDLQYQMSRLELIDEVRVRAINIANGKNLPEALALMFESIDKEAYT